MRDMQKRHLCRDNTNMLMLRIIERSAICGNHAILIQVQLVVLVIIDYPSRLVPVARRCVPFLCEIIIILFLRRRNRVAILSDRISHKMAWILWNDVWLDTDSTPIGIGVEMHNTL